MSTWAWLITRPEMVRGRAVSSDSSAPRENLDSPGNFSFPPLSMA
jgi:hypothetical protein